MPQLRFFACATPQKRWQHHQKQQQEQLISLSGRTQCKGVCAVRSWVALSSAMAGQTRKLIWQVILLASGLAPCSLHAPRSLLSASLPLPLGVVKMSLPRTAAMWQAWKSFGRHKHTLSQNNAWRPSAGCWLFTSWLFTRLPVDETLTSARHRQDGSPGSSPQWSTQDCADPGSPGFRGEVPAV